MKPFVSVITPTKNRPEFFVNILRNFFRQDYPHDKMELLIGDDSDISYENLIEKTNNIKYFYMDKVSIGEKRNRLLSESKGDIIIFMDDDDYYPVDKVSYVVDNLWNSKYLVSGSSKMYIYFICFDKIYSFGPYNKKGNEIYHTTCGTMSFKRKFLENHRFPNNDKAEEKAFLNNWSVPILQLDPLKSILCISHLDNTVDKHKYLKSGIKTDLTLENIIPNKIDIDFYKNLLNLQSGGEFKIIDLKN